MLIALGIIIFAFGLFLPVILEQSPIWIIVFCLLGIALCIAGSVFYAC